MCCAKFWKHFGSFRFRPIGHGFPTIIVACLLLVLLLRHFFVSAVFWDPYFRPALQPAGAQIAHALSGAERRKSLSADSPETAQRYAAILSGARPLAVAVVMLSCTTDACVAERDHIRAHLFEPFHRAAAATENGDAKDGFLYCPAADSVLAPLRNHDGLLPWQWLQRHVRLHHFFAVGADGLKGREAAAASLAAERALYNDVVAVPGGDGYHDIFLRVAAVFGALGVNAACSEEELRAMRKHVPFKATAAEALGADNKLALLPFDSDFVADFVLKVDTDSFLRLPQYAAALYDLIHAASAAANSSDPDHNMQNGVAVPAPAPELFWGHFFSHSVDHQLLREGFPPGGTGYTLSRGLVAAISRRVRPFHLPTCGITRVRVLPPHDLRDFLPGEQEDIVTSTLVHTHAHAKVSDERFHDQLSRGHPMARPVTPASLVVHKAYRDTWLALARYFSDGNEDVVSSKPFLRSRGGVSVPWPVPARSNGGCAAHELPPNLQYV